ncbi:hypothetical protein C8Q77DRAFT_142020 [Trametes polyzona]|nr:hypothetical protein C8Q77DRAFT_142020 [Trametes polyzona]
MLLLRMSLFLGILAASCFDVPAASPLCISCGATLSTQIDGREKVVCTNRRTNNGTPATRQVPAGPSAGSGGQAGADRRLGCLTVHGPCFRHPDTVPVPRGGPRASIDCECVVPSRALCQGSATKRNCGGAAMIDAGCLRSGRLFAPAD